MTDSVERIPGDVWARVVEYMPIPSVDLVVRCGNGILLAKRENEPARGDGSFRAGGSRKGSG
jgi:colanic acid biosynthesis protein WcaH